MPLTVLSPPLASKSPRPRLLTMRTVAALLAFAASALAYAVTEPAPSTGWTTTGPNVVAWNMVSTDPANFTIVLSNQV